MNFGIGVSHTKVGLLDVCSRLLGILGPGIDSLDVCSRLSTLDRCNVVKENSYSRVCSNFFSAVLA